MLLVDTQGLADQRASKFLRWFFLPGSYLPIISFDQLASDKKILILSSLSEQSERKVLIKLQKYADKIKFIAIFQSQTITELSTIGD